MFHTAHDGATFLAEVLLFVAVAIGLIYAIVIIVGLCLKFFRSRKAVRISLVLSAFSSIPLVAAVVLQWPYLPDEWDTNPVTGVLTLVDLVLLTFVWTVPAVQFRVLREAHAQQ